MNAGPSVAVIVAAYRSEEVVARAVKSALTQPEAGEVVVVVDGSPDRTAESARASDDGSGRLIVIEQSANRGPAAARNTAIGSSRSDWIAILDDDDFMEPGRLKRLLALSDNCDFVADDILLEEESAPCSRSPMWFEGEAKPEAVTLASFVRANCPDPARPRRELGFIKPLMRRAFLTANSLAYDEDMRLGEDYDLYARALAKGARFLLVGAQGYVAVRRTNSLSGRHSTRDLRALRAADERLLRFGGLSGAERAAIKAHWRTTDKRYQWRRLIDAVKARRPVEFAKCFCSDPGTSAHLAQALGAEVARRFLARGTREVS